MKSGAKIKGVRGGNNQSNQTCLPAGREIRCRKKGATRPQRRQDKLAWLAWRAGVGGRHCRINNLVLKSKIHIFYLFVDIVLIGLCLFLPYIFRYNPDAVRRLYLRGTWQALWLPDIGQHFLLYLFWTVVIILFFFLHNLYQTRRELSYLDEAGLVLKALFFSSLPAAAAVFFLQIKEFSRLVFLANIVGLAVALVFWRLWKRHLVRRRVAKGFNNQHVLIIGAGKVGRALAREIEKNRYLGLEIVGFLDDHQEGTVEGYPVLGPCRDFEKVVRQKFVDEALVTIPAMRDLVSRLILSARKLVIGIKVVPDLLSLGMEGIKASYLGMVPLLEYYSKGLHGADLILKRAFDILVSVLALIVFAPLILALSLIIKLSSPGPVFYVSQRSGRKGKVFKFYKFRTMIEGADRMLESLRHLDETDGPIFKIRKDPRVTGVGRFLRRYSLDELPQLWNVLRGDMSLVGPRPPTPEEVRQYADWQLKRLEIRPGITCLWQVKGRSNLSFREWMKLDLFYIENWSFGLDIKILLLTIGAVLKRQGAY